ncbi:hypothetical protein CEUSTIGMA_g13719.t1 [Chlamydomonas eustigma]|uniref:guanylate cyclase n=1 Tax=Chlamydomonas eustigma TaxID=1157962 RepID=A0A250XTB3_9CHLO|nr:hypothetical protein CEUSTIGMA_g13719.t1 [Chlamydomonas eustigma]|eukprot:GAX86307.1 hypothetical protein CEUSTIGMA_g13719.t1 [Chlamydomonas eustigma]
MLKNLQARFELCLLVLCLIECLAQIMYPDMEWNYQRLALLSACSFLLSTGSTTSARVGDGKGLMLKGQFFETEMDGAPVLVFMGSPRLTSLEHMRSHGLRLCDIPSHDMARDYLLINDQQRSEEDRIKQLQVCGYVCTKIRCSWVCMILLETKLMPLLSEFLSAMRGLKRKSVLQYFMLYTFLYGMKMDRDRMAKEARWIEKEAIWFEKEKNKAEAACERLKESLNQALSKLAEQDLLEIPDKSPSMHYSRIADIDMATPAGKALQLIDKILSGEKVSKHEAMQAHDAILDAGTELFRPQNFGAKLGMTGMDTDVNQALVNMLDISRRNTGWSDANPEELLEKAEAMRERLHMEREEARVSTRRRSTHNGDSLSGLVGPITQSVVAKKAVLLPKKSFGGSPSLRFQESVLRRHSMAGSSSNEDPRERAAASSSASAVLSRGASRGVSRSGLAALVSTVDLGDPRWRKALQTPDSMVPLLMSTLSIAPAGQTDRIISLPGTMNRRVTIMSSSGSSSAETERSTAAESAITHVERASLGIMGRQNHHEVLPRLRPARNSEETGCSVSMSIPDGSPTAKAFSNSIPTSSFSNSIPTSSLGKQLESQSSNQFNVRQRLSTGLVSSVQAATESSATMSSAFTPWQSAAVSVVPVGGRVSKLMPSPPEYPSRFQRSISHTRSSHISDLNEVRFNRVRMPPVPRFTNCLSPTRASQEREREGGMLLAGRQHSPTRRDTLSRNQAASSIVEVEDQAGNQKKGGGKLAVSSIGVASPAVGSTNSASTSASRLNTPGGALLLMLGVGSGLCRRSNGSA